MYDITGLSADRQGWRCNSGGEPTLNWLCNSTRGADLLVCAARARTAMSGASDVHLGELVMHTGRPVLVVPGGIEHIWLEHVAVCWSETAEARRAVADAMPILLQSDKVTVVEVVNEGAEEECRWRLRGVVQWLRDHGVRADYRIDVSSAPRAGACAPSCRLCRLTWWLPVYTATAARSNGLPAVSVATFCSAASTAFCYRTKRPRPAAVTLRPARAGPAQAAPENTAAHRAIRAAGAAWTAPDRRRAEYRRWSANADPSRSTG